MAAKVKYYIRKYDGDHSNSWAVFQYGVSTPMISGLSMADARWYKTQFETGKMP